MCRIKVSLLCLALAGCATAPSDVSYSSVVRNWDVWAIDDRPVNSSDTITVTVPEFTVVLMPFDDLNEFYATKYPGQKGKVWGFAEPANRTFYVRWANRRWDKDGFPLPDLETLGHELWHMPELGNMWHD